MIDMPKLPTPTEAFVIYDPKTEKFSRGSCCPSWTKKPKVWSALGPLKSHLAMFIVFETIGDWRDGNRSYNVHRANPYNEGCVIFDIVRQEQVCTVQQLYAAMIDDRIKKNEKNKQKRIKEMKKKIEKMMEI